MKATLFQIIFLVIVLLLLNGKNHYMFAQDQQVNQFVGKWLSEDLVEASLSFKVRNGPVRYKIIIEENNGQLQAVLDSRDKNMKINGDEIEVMGDSISIKFKEIDAIYRGRLNSSKDQLMGSLIFLGRMITMGLRKD
jgi:hypothetical protein